MSCVEDINIHEGDIGTTFDVSVVDSDGAAIDISTATLIEFIFERPNGWPVLIGAGVLVSGGTTGRARHTWTTVNGEAELYPAGTWKVQVHVVTPTMDFKTAIGRFPVKRNILGFFTRHVMDTIGVSDSLTIS